MDTEPSTRQTVQNSVFGKLFTHDNQVFGKGGASNNWAKGHNADLIDPIMDAIRREAEACDCIQGFQITHSLGGGTGSGLGSAVCEQIKDRYPEHILSNIAVFPSPKLSDTVVEPYNTTLSFQALLEHSNDTFVIDNEALYNIAQRTLRLETPSYEDINKLMVMVSLVVPSG